MPPRTTARALALCAAVLAATTASAQTATGLAGVTPFTGAETVSGTQTPTRGAFVTAAQNAGADPHNVIDFQDVPLNIGNQTTGLTDTAYTRLGFVKFLTTSNYSQEIILGYNVGQPNNNVYTTAARSYTLPIADVTFGRGVTAFGFDFKNTNNPGLYASVVQTFTFALYSGSALLGSYSGVTQPTGSDFTFEGFTSGTPITEMVVTSPVNPSNLDLVLDNFAISDQVGAAGTTAPEPATLALLGAGMLATAALVRRRPRA